MPFNGHALDELVYGVVIRVVSQVGKLVVKAGLTVAAQVEYFLGLDYELVFSFQAKV